MSFAELLRSGPLPVALEITPPQRPLWSVLVRRARLLGDAAQAVNVIQRPGRQSSLEACLTLREAGFDPVWHLVTRGRTRSEIGAEIERAAAGGIQQVLCIRGDHNAADTADTPTIREAIGEACSSLTGPLVGASLNQYLPDRAAVLRNLAPKLRAGASFVQTQPVFDPRCLERYLDVLRREFPGVKLIAMVTPVLSPLALEGIERRLQIGFPAGSPFRAGAPDAASAWAAFQDLVAALVKDRLADGIAVMTTEMDPSPETGASIVAALRAGGVGAV
jgi:methylenetetrahydrofolate reductase (NADPH)